MIRLINFHGAPERVNRLFSRPGIMYFISHVCMYILLCIYQSPFIANTSMNNDNNVMYNSLPYNYMSNISHVFVINHDFPHSKIIFETTPVPFPSSISISRSSMSIKHSSRRVCSLLGSNPISVVSLWFDTFKSNTRKKYDLYGFCFRDLHHDNFTESKHGSSQITRNYPSFYLLI